MRPRAIGVALAFASLAGAASREKIELRPVVLDLPGAPVKIVATDLDADGRRDLLAVVAYDDVGEIGEDRIVDRVQFSTVRPTIVARRELRAYRADGAGYREAAAPLELPVSFTSLEAGPPGVPAVAVADDGVYGVRLAAQPGPAALTLERLVARPSLFAGSEAFQAELHVVVEATGDGVADVLFPGVDGWELFRGTGSGLDATQVVRLELPEPRERTLSSRDGYLAIPEVLDATGDGIPDLVVREGGFAGGSRIHLLPGVGGGRFGTLRETPRDCHDLLTDLRVAGTGENVRPWPEDLVAVEDLDSDGRAEAVLRTPKERPGDGIRAEMKDAKRPIHRWSFHRLRDAGMIESDPYAAIEAEGHGMDVDEDRGPSWRQLQDLDGDGRTDLVTFTLDFSMMQAVRVLTSKRISIGMDFKVFCQGQDGSFREVTGLDLSEKLKLDLNDLKLDRIGQFAGDFDGDGRRDFVHLGRGKTVTIHRGEPGCRYPVKPDLAIDLPEEPDGLDLVTVEDVDGDGLTDLRILRPLPSTDRDRTAPVRVELYLSGLAP